tara:strand:- start:2515 stop:3573 length:1059 start_codon:yes stop_codon:yes gene_type:complete
MKMKFQNILVTGGAGFIGSNLICRLLNEYNVNVFNIDKLGFPSDLTSINNLVNSDVNKFSHKYKFFNTDLIKKDQIKDIFEIANPDLVIHLAAESHVDRSIEYPMKFIMSNVVGTLNILDCALEHYKKLSSSKKEIFRFHHVSTDEVFGSLSRISEGFNELSKYDPRSPYSASKAASDHLVNAWHHTYKFPISLSNCSNNYGPWQFPEKLIPLVINKAINLKKIPIYGDGSNIRDWLHVNDHIDAILSIVQDGAIGSNYCVGGSNEITNNNLVNMICSYLDFKLPKNISYKELITYIDDRPGHDFRYAIDSGLIKKDLGWTPKVDFNLGLNKTIDWYVENNSWSQSVMKKYN